MSNLIENQIVGYFLQWLKKQAEARRVIELEDENLSEEEKNPIWLRDKGKYVHTERAIQKHRGEA